MNKPMYLVRLVTALGASCLSLVAHSNPYFDATLPHHTERGFRNTAPDTAPKKLGELLPGAVRIAPGGNLDRPRQHPGAGRRPERADRPHLQ